MIYWHFQLVFKQGWRMNYNSFFNAQNEFLRKSPSHWHSAVSPIVTAVRCNIGFSLKETLGNYFESLQRGTDVGRRKEPFVCYWTSGQVLDGLLGLSLMNTWWLLTKSLMEIFIFISRALQSKFTIVKNIKFWCRTKIPCNFVAPWNKTKL